LKPTVGDLAEVVYDDITEHDNSSEKDVQALGPKRMRVFGRIMLIDKDKITIVVEEDMDFRTEHNAYCIPIGCLKKAVRLVRG
jgi:hypothetical protein